MLTLTSTINMIGIKSIASSRDLSRGKYSLIIKYMSMLCFIIVSHIKLIDYGILCVNSHRFLNPPKLSTIPNIAQNQILDGYLKSFSNEGRNIWPRRKTRAVYLATNSINITSNLDQNYTISSATPTNSNYLNDQPQILEQCCACDEAKYELVFEGLWSRHTHPDEFPENYWLARFSDIIGASHSNEFRMWQENSLATEGVKELAETGSTKKLEAELKQVSSKTRTIIKARELHHPTLNSKTSAVFRTDRHHHLVSILSKLSPSPDWMVGVSGLELCQVDCSWATQRIVNLYLWDAGTDSGTTFTAPDVPTRPQERIHPFRKVNSGSAISTTKSTVINQQSSDPNYSTNYDDSSIMNAEQQSANDQQPTESSQAELSASASEQTKPFARLTITRQRIYEKSCNGETVTPSRHQPHLTASQDSWLEPTRVTYSDCSYTDWSDWASCSSTCGKGIRTRTRGFLNEQAHLVGCSQVDLIEKEVCLSECVGNTTCVTQDWSEWSKCSVDCGHGFRKRTRSPIRPLKRACNSVELAETEPCLGPQTGNCTAEPVLPNCEVTDWSQWSDCSVACGKGTRIRTRQYVRKDSIESCNVKLIQKQSCTGRPELCKQTTKGQTLVQQKPNPDLPVIDCKLSSWGPWSTCSALCGRGKRVQSRYIIQMPQNGGKPCDKKLTRKQNCKDLPPCPHQNDSSRRNQTNGRGHKQQVSSDSNEHRRTATSTTTTPASSMMDDEDDSKFSRLLKSESGLVQPASFSSMMMIGNGSSAFATPQGEMILLDDKLIRPRYRPCEYGNWTQWSDCEVVCQPVKKGSSKVRQKLPLSDQASRCQIIEELYYCDPDIYC